MVALAPSSAAGGLVKSVGSVTTLVSGWGCWPSKPSKHEPVGDAAGHGRRRNAIVAFLSELLEPDLRARHADEVKLHALGYRQELSRDLTLLNVFGVAIATLSYYWVTGVVYLGMLHGGPVSLVYGWMVTWFFNLLAGLSLAELSSAYPTSGALYYMCWAIAPPRMRRPASYFVAWFNIVSQMTVTTSLQILLVLLLQEFVALCTIAISGAPHIFTSGQLFGIYCGVVVSQALLLSGRQAVSSFLFTVAGLWHVVPVIALITAMLCLAPSFQPSSWVWASWEPNTEVTGMTSPLLTFLIGAQTAQIVFIGFDAPIHMSEETLQASVTTPAAVVLNLVATGLLGGMYLLTMLYAVQDPTGSGPDAPPTNNFLVLTLYGAFQSRYGQGSLCAPMLFIPTVAGYLASLCSLAVNSRFFFAISRDGAFPFSSVLAVVHEGTKVPLAALWLSVTISMGIGAICLYVPIAMSITLASSSNATTLVMAVPLVFRACHSWSNETFLAGPFTLGRFGAPIAALGAAWQLLFTVIQSFPGILPTTAVDMNYSSVPLVAMLLLTTASWFCPRYGARHWFNGPKSTLGAGLRSTSGAAPAPSEPMQWQQDQQQADSHSANAKHRNLFRRLSIVSSFSFSFRQTREQQEQTLLELKEQQLYCGGRSFRDRSVRSGLVRGGSMNDSGLFNNRKLIGDAEVKVELAAEGSGSQVDGQGGGDDGTAAVGLATTGRRSSSSDDDHNRS